MPRWLFILVFSVTACDEDTPDRSVTAQPERPPPSPIYAFPAPIQNPDTVWREGENARGGLVFPKSMVFSARDVEVVNSAGVPVPFQLHPLGMSWPDGSMRHALLQVQTIAWVVSCGRRASTLQRATLRARQQLSGRRP